MEITDRYKLKENVALAVEEGLAILKELKKKPHGYFDWPSLSVYDNGLPNLSSSSMFSGPPDYRSVFEGYKPEFPAKEISSFQNLLSFIKSEDWLKEKLLPKGLSSKKELGEMDERFLEHETFRLPLEAIDRYVHINQSFDFQEAGFDLVYEPIENTLFLEKLGIDIYVPILFVKFPFDTTVLGQNVSIERMDDLFHLARFPLKSYGPGVHPSVLSSATHCLVLRDWHLQNRNLWELIQILTDKQALPLGIINNFFGSLRIITGINTGYAQVLLRPRDWAIHYKGYLPPLEGTSINEYPLWFENYYWLEESIPEIGEQEVRDIGKLYFELSDIEENSIRIAVRRLNLCFLRENDEDYILDATIGMEALLSDDNRQEMTHKLAMRMGALSTLDTKLERKPYQVFKEIKKIYSYRSAIVHGSKQSNKSKEIVRVDNSKISASALAIEYLRMAIKMLIENPKYRQPENIDKYLLLDSSQN